MKRWVLTAVCAVVVLGGISPVAAQNRRDRNWRNDNHSHRHRDRDRNRDSNGSFWTGAVVGGVVGGIIGHEIGDDDRYDRRYTRRSNYRDRYDDRYYRDSRYDRDRYGDRYAPVYESRTYVTREYYQCRTHRDPCRCVPPPRCETRFYRAPRCD